MKTYEDNGYRYWWDWTLKMWAIYSIDSNGNQVGNADYHGTKERLKTNYPQLQFIHKPNS